MSKLWIIPFALVILLLGCVGTYRVVGALAPVGLAAEKAPPPSVDVAVAARRDLADVAVLVGTVRPLNVVDVVPDVPGRVLSISVDVGTGVGKGDVLAILDSTEATLGREQAAAGLAMATANREAAARDLAAAEPVEAAGGMTQTQLAGLRSRLEVAEAQVLQAKAALGLAQERVADATIRSPIAGTVTRRATGVGRLASPGVALFQIQDLSGLEVEADADGSTASRLTVGATVEVVDDASSVPGVVKTVSPSLDSQSRRSNVVFALAEGTTGVMPFSTVRVRVPLTQRPAVVAVPHAALMENGATTSIFVVLDGSARLTTVQVGVRDGEWVEVAGVAEGASVVVAGQGALKDGAAVTVRGQVPA